MSDPGPLLATLASRLAAFRAEAHSVLAIHEASPSRIVLLDATYRKLAGLTLKQDELFRQALRCIESDLFRASHVMAWAGFMDFLEQKLASDGLVKVRAARAAWKGTTIEDLREEVPEAQLLDVARAVRLCGKTELKALHGLLNKRNECAHPTDYYPDFNQTLGYLSELFQRIVTLQPRTL